MRKGHSERSVKLQRYYGPALFIPGPGDKPASKKLQKKVTKRLGFVLAAKADQSKSEPPPSDNENASDWVLLGEDGSDAGFAVVPAMPVARKPSVGLLGRNDTERFASPIVRVPAPGLSPQLENSESLCAQQLGRLWGRFNPFG